VGSNPFPCITFPLDKDLNNDGLFFSIGVGKSMDKKPLILVSICAMVLLVLGSLSNVVGYQSVQTSQQSVIKERINKRELLFQTIVDISNNKEIQQIILKSQMSRGIFPVSKFPVITKDQIRQMYFIGLILSKFLSKSRMHSIIGKYHYNNQEIQKEISSGIEKDATLNADVTQLQESKCDCENENTTDWNFSIICDILTILILYHIFMSIIFLKIFETFHNKPILQAIFYVMGMYQLIIITAIEFLYYFIFNCPPPGQIHLTIDI
jgi:hypothetical protein